MAKNKQELLHTPEGIWDHYGKDFADYNTVTGTILDRMHAYGYEDIKTPTVEYFDVFSNEIGTTPSRELYKFFDKEGDTLCLRPDFTPGVARCAAKYFMDESDPIRFCYKGSAFTNTTNLQGKLKESTQMGAEFINDDSAYADGEMIALLIESLKATGLSKFQITVGNVEYFKGICDAAGIDDDTENQLREYISGKNYYAAEALLESKEVDASYKDQFLQITNLVGNDADLEKIQASAPNDRSRSALERLSTVYKILKGYGLEKYVSIDLSLLSKFRYYTGIIFKGYTYGVGDAVASGGRYDMLLSYFGKDAAAIGFMIVVDTVVEALRAQKIEIPAAKEVQVLEYTQDTYEETLKRAAQIRAEGGRVALNLKR